MKGVVFVCLFLLSSCIIEASQRYDSLSSLSSRDTFTCPKMSCASGGQNCFSDENKEVFCAGTDIYCNSTNNLCTIKKVDGSPCRDSFECANDYCTSNKCATPEAYYQPIGSACSVDRACSSFMCNNGSCVGNPDGAYCTSGNQCISRLCVYLPEYRCSTPPTGGSPCALIGTGSGLTCGQGYSCEPRRKSDESWVGLCIPENTGKLGEFCEAEQSTGCDDEMTCLDRIPGEKYGRCGVATQSTNRPCEIRNGDCTNNASIYATEDCMCNGVTGLGVCINSLVNNPKGNRAANNLLSQCYIGECKNNQSLECAKVNCRDAYCAYTKIQIALWQDKFDGLYPQCYSDLQLKEFDISGCPETSNTNGNSNTNTNGNTNTGTPGNNNSSNGNILSALSFVLIAVAAILF